MKYLIAALLTIIAISNGISQSSTMDSLGISHFGVENWEILKFNLKDKNLLAECAKIGEKALTKDEYKRYILKGEKPPKKLKEKPIEKQEKKPLSKLIKDEDHEEIMDALTDAHIPRDAFWIGEPNPEKYRKVRNALLLYNMWNPADTESTEYVKIFNQIEEENENLQVIHFVNPHVIKHYTIDELHQLWFSIEKKRPLVVGVHDRIINRINEEGINAFFISGRSILKEIHSEKGIKDIGDLIKFNSALIDKKSDRVIHHSRNYIDFKDVMLSPSDVIYVNSPEAEEIFICDKWNDRIFRFTTNGLFLDILGHPKSGFLDEEYFRAKFNRPSELAFHAPSNKLYITDEVNHAIRSYSLDTKRVKTEFGTGGRAELVKDEINGVLDALYFPGELKIEGDFGYLTANHGKVLYKIDFQNQKLTSILSSNSAAFMDGNLKKASIEKIHCMAVKGASLLILDGESSFNLREVSEKKTKTLLDSTTLESLNLIHPTEMELIDDEIWITDSYQNQIFIINESGKLLRTIGNGLKGFSNPTDSVVRFNQPSGITQMKGKVLVADALNGCVRSVDAGSSIVTGFKLEGIEEFLEIPMDSYVKRLSNEIPIDSTETEVFVKLDFSDIKELDITSLNLNVINEQGVEFESFDRMTGDIKLKILPDSSMGNSISFELSFTSLTSEGNRPARSHFYKLRCSMIEPQLYHTETLNQMTFKL